MPNPPKKKKKGFLDSLIGGAERATPGLNIAASVAPYMGTGLSNIVQSFKNQDPNNYSGLGNQTRYSPQQQPPITMPQTTPTTQTATAPDTTVFDSMKNQPLSENSPYITSRTTGSTDPHWYAQLDSSTYGSPFRMPTHKDATAAGVGITLKALGGSNADPDAVALFQQSADDALMQQADQIRQNGGIFTSIDYWNTLGLLWQHIQAQVAQQKAPPAQTTTNTAGQNGNPIMTSQGVFKP